MNKLVLIEHKYGILGLISELYINVIPTLAKFFSNLYVNRYSTVVYVQTYGTLNTDMYPFFVHFIFSFSFHIFIFQ